MGVCRCACLSHVAGLRLRPSQPERTKASLSLSNTIDLCFYLAVSCFSQSTACLAYLQYSPLDFTPPSPATVLSSLPTKTARGDLTSVLSVHASLPPIYTTRLLSFTLPSPFRVRRRLLCFAFASSTGIAQASCSYSPSPTSSSPLLSA